MKAYWANLNDRERWMVGLAAVICFFYLFYSLLFSPLHEAALVKSKQLVEKSRTLNWMQQVRGQHKLKSGPQTLSNSQLLTLLANQLQTSTVFQQFPNQLQQTGTGDIQLSFERVPFNSFITWLSTISKRYSILIKQFNAEQTDVSGVTKVTLIISSA